MKKEKDETGIAGSIETAGLSIKSSGKTSKEMLSNIDELIKLSKKIK